MKKHLLKIDMTPMVDLGFLLVSFFVITIELSKPTAMNLVMPTDETKMPVKESNSLTVLIGQNNLFYYHGKWEDAVKNNLI